MTNDGDVYSWGENQYGQIGNGTNTTDQLTPYKITALDAPVIVKMSVGDARYTSAFAIDNNNDLYSWGYNRSGGLGNGTATGNFNTPTLVAGVKVSEVKTAGYYTSTRIIKTDSTIMVAGENNDGQLGINSTTDQNNFGRRYYSASFTT